MIKRISLMLALLFSFAAFATPVCRVNLRSTGTYFNQCPRSMVAQGVDVRITPGPYPYVNVYVQCANTEVICTEMKKDLQKEIK